MASDAGNAAQSDSLPSNTPPPPVSSDGLPRLRAAEILDSITEAFVTLDGEWRFTYLNDQAARMLARTRAELLGSSVWEAFPETVGTVSDREYRRAIAERVAVWFEQFYAPLGAWFDVRAYPSSEGLLVFFQDITERAERGRRERFLAELAERARGLTDPDVVIADAVDSVGRFLGVSRCVFVDIDIEADVCTARPDYRADDSVASMAGVFALSAFGEVVVAAYGAGRPVAVDDVHVDRAQVPEASVAAYDAVGIRAHASVPVVHSDRLVSCIGVHSSAPRHWTPEEVELLQTVVDRTWLTVEVLRQQRARAREAEERREAHERTARILESITDAFLALDADWRFTYLNDQSERVMGREREGLLGRSLWDEFPAVVGSRFEREFRRAVDGGETVTFEEFYPPLDIWVEVRAYPSPEGLSVFYQDVTARKRAEAERERLLAEQRARAERESVLNRIGQTIRSATTPEAVQEAAVRLLGEALGADRCYLALYDLERGVVTVARDSHRAGLASIRGAHPFPNTAEMFHELYRGGATSVIGDARAAPLSAPTRVNMERLGLRARVSVALADGEGRVATLTAAMADDPREWTEGEVALVEAVATQLRTAVEMARAVQREHNIAQQLQAALQPGLPGAVAGLAVDRYYEAALAEAGVGGDFYDVYAVEKGCTVLVVGDLSGKGLAAAAQVSVVRNMLRAFLYSRPTAGEAVTELNRVLAENDLLTGFSTLFVGIYDGAARLLRYVNCGQEPALVRRAGSGRVEELRPTGPVLGSFEGAVFAEQTVSLGPGDALAMFTDGLTEVGASRTDMLGVEGVAALLARPVAAGDAQGMAEALTRDLIAGVNGFAPAVARDDMCLLVAVVCGG